VSWRYLDLADYLLIAEAVLGLPAERLAEMPRVINLASSARAVPSSGWSGHDAYPEVAQKAGLLAARLTKNHPLPDGNKRTAWLAMIEFIERNDRQLIEPHVDDAVNTMFRLAAGTLSEADFVEWLRPRIVGTE
jgi:death-on-curing protein